jgi:uncharacterized protein Yka (UPF0111/DUF47 family)
MMNGEIEEGEAELDEVDEDLLQHAFNNEELSGVIFFVIIDLKTMIN